jgi:hypothetical protein
MNNPKNEKCSGFGCVIHGEPNVVADVPDDQRANHYKAIRVARDATIRPAKRIRAVFEDFMESIQKAQSIVPGDIRIIDEITQGHLNRLTDAHPPRHGRTP